MITSQFRHISIDIDPCVISSGIILSVLSHLFFRRDVASARRRGAACHLHARTWFLDHHLTTSSRYTASRSSRRPRAAASVSSSAVPIIAAFSSASAPTRRPRKYSAPSSVRSMRPRQSTTVEVL